MLIYTYLGLQVLHLFAEVLWHSALMIAKHGDSAICAVVLQQLSGHRLTF